MGRRADPRFLPDDVRLGNVSGLHGIRGEVKLFLYNPASDLIGKDLDAILVGPTGERRPAHLHLRTGAGRRILAALDAATDRDQAAALMGFEVVLPASALPPAGPDAWYHRDLVGLPVRTVEGRSLGNIAEIYDTGEVDVWLLRVPDGDRVLPALRRNLVSVRLRQGDEPGEVVVTEDAVDDRPPV